MKEELRVIGSLLGMLGCLGGVVLAIVNAVHNNYSQATFMLGLVIMYRVFDIPSKRGT